MNTKRDKSRTCSEESRQNSDLQRRIATKPTGPKPLRCKNDQSLSSLRAADFGIATPAASAYGHRLKLRHQTQFIVLDGVSSSELRKLLP
jgi:hypothetical protein